MKFPEIIYRDRWLIVLNKPAGWLSEGGKNGEQDATVWIQQEAKLRFAAAAHRLDRVTSGLLIVATGKEVLKNLHRMQEEKQIVKKYIAITGGKMPAAQAGEFHHWLKKSEEEMKAIVRDRQAAGYQSVSLKYRVREDRGFLHWELDLPGGKYHQIRAQLAHQGNVILGDVRYGFPGKEPVEKIALQACSLELMHPVSKQKLSLQAPLPDDWGDTRRY